MAYNIADLFEHTVDAVPDRTALIYQGRSWTFEELDRRANRVAHWLAGHGVAPGAHVGIYAMNSEAWVSTMIGCLKIRAVPININYRYVEAELEYLIHNSEIVACVFDEQYATRLEAVRSASPALTTLAHVESHDPLDGEPPEDTAGALERLGSVPFEEVCAAGSPSRDFPERSGDDHFIIYTGGTTGMPKGVVWRSEDIYFALGQGIDALTKERVASEYTRAEQAAASEQGLVFCVIPPLMHGAAQIATLSQWFIGSTIIMLRRFDAEAVWDAVDRYGLNSMIITGDAIARPMIDALDENPGRWNTDSLLSVSSSAALFSQSLKDRFIEYFPNVLITDSLGSTEGGFNGIRIAPKGERAEGGGPRIDPGQDVVILDENLELVPKDDRTPGMLARGGNIPLGYYNDPEKTAANFVIAADGKRYAIPGDHARWSDDGSLVMLGRGTVSINSGGEKIFPEEVEAALKSNPAVFDCLVVGVPDERFGQRVAAVVQWRPGQSATLAELDASARKLVAGFKVPRELHTVEEVVRSPAGKPDYRWAKELAESGTHLVD
ncbi:MAG: acyl-CoA synthetase [Microthrixaceae bacterium]|nr:acyl-CoA synthetase [Microthrixaceae bacterium]